MSPAPELKATLTLPQTAFPMKANLPQNEPLRLARWASLRLYEELREGWPGRPAYLLHDGPPYANGPIHLGHALNKGLKDFVVKSKTMAGFDSPYVPGYDCHGLPIEIKVDEQLGRKKLEMPVPAVLDACRDYAQKYVDLQTSQFERIGCFGRWDKPYKTMARDYEARTLEAFYGFLEKGFVYRGLKPVYWCIHDRTALAEAEVEYEMHTSPSIYVRYRLTSDPAALAPALAGREVYTIIWTTTPWTLPASHGRRLPSGLRIRGARCQWRPKMPGAPSDPVYIVAAELAPAGHRRLQARRDHRARPLQRQRSSSAPPSSIRSSSAASSACWPPTSPPTPAPAPSTLLPRTAPTTSTPASVTISTRPAASMPPAIIHVDPDAWPLAAPPAFEGQDGLGGQSHHRRHARRARRAAGRRATWSTPTRTAGAATIPSSSAPPSSGSSRSKRR